jgi:hypothetical protein
MARNKGKHLKPSGELYQIPVFLASVLLFFCFGLFLPHLAIQATRRQ